MRVSIEHREKTVGLIFTKTVYEVVLTVNFSEEEQEAIRKHDLGDTIVLKRRVDATHKNRDNLNPELFDALIDGAHLRIKNLTAGRPDSYACATPREAKEYEAELQDAMPRLKAYIVDNATPVATGAKTYEF